MLLAMPGNLAANTWVANSNRMYPRCASGVANTWEANGTAYFWKAASISWSVRLGTSVAISSTMGSALGTSSAAWVKAASALPDLKNVTIFWMMLLRKFIFFSFGFQTSELLSCHWFSWPAGQELSALDRETGNRVEVAV